jgi:hypothetical protein
MSVAPSLRSTPPIHLMLNQHAYVWWKVSRRLGHACNTDHVQRQSTRICKDYIEHSEFQPFRIFGIPIVPNFASYRGADEIKTYIEYSEFQPFRIFGIPEFQSFRILFPNGVLTILFLEKYYNKRVIVLCHSVLELHSRIFKFWNDSDFGMPWTSNSKF